MKTNKMVIATFVLTVLLFLLIGWAFYQALQLNSDGKLKTEEYPKKAVMAQAQSLNKARLDRLAESGKIAAGMSMEQVRLALGEPDRIEKDGMTKIIWWYRHDNWMNIVFDSFEKVIQINQKANSQNDVQTSVVK